MQIDPQLVTLVAAVVGPAVTAYIAYQARVEQKARARDLDATATQKIEGAASSLAKSYEARLQQMDLKYAELDNKYTCLLDKYNDLESKYIDAQAISKNQAKEIGSLQDKISELNAQVETQAAEILALRKENQTLRSRLGKQ